MTTPPPTTSDYWVGPMIGEGSFAQVFYGKHKTTGREVAIKVVEQVTCRKHPAILQGVLTEQKLLQELKSCRNNNHVVNLLASFLDSECVYLVMELALGGDLQALIQRGHDSDTLQTWKASIPYYAKQLMEAVQFLQSKNIVHADLKPQNCLLDSSGKLCLADFASAFQVSDDNNTPMTPQEAVIPRGTSQYACPELIKSQTPLTASVDVWSLGCIFYCMFIGKSPFETESEALTVQAILEYVTQQQQQQNGRVLLEGYPLCDGWDTFIGRLLETDPTQRLEAFTEASSTGAPLPMGEIPAEESILLPKAPWEELVKRGSLKDGAGGWQVFML